MENKSFKVAGIANLIKRNYNVEVDLLDLEALIDNSLSMAENWFNIKPKVLMLCPKPFKIMFM